MSCGSFARRLEFLFVVWIDIPGRAKDYYVWASVQIAERRTLLLKPPFPGPFHLVLQLDQRAS